MVVKKDGIHIGTISGGVVNFGGAVFNSPITVSKSVRGSGGDNTGTIVITNVGCKI
ncbi:spore germination protein [Bacillus salipaludis]|uniref:spore germination protein n=1 Tax=Bacillus salipaludis TaxID=2547811 RepID=UPI002E216F0D|nr:spore germination protein [Bacillus salipaludis]